MQHDLFSPGIISNLLPKDGMVEVWPYFFSPQESEQLLKNLIDSVHWKQETMKFYGKEVKQPRLTAWYGEGMKEYSYSGLTMKIYPWTEELLFIKARVEKQAGLTFTSVLLNYYRNGNDSVSWHRDNEKVLRVNPVIASVSLGATRTFKFRHVDDHKLVRSIELTNGTFVLMKGETQHKWEHAILKTSKPVGERISLTYRILF